jgi:hypothetical protein
MMAVVGTKMERIERMKRPNALAMVENWRNCVAECPLCAILPRSRVNSVRPRTITSMTIPVLFTLYSNCKQGQPKERVLQVCYKVQYVLIQHVAS